MRIRKNKRHRKTVRFYQTCFGFRKPFKVLCDGTFISHLISNSLLPADETISNLLSGSATLFVSRCIIGELKSLQKEFPNSVRAASELLVAPCDHFNGRKNAAACILDVIGDNNPEHYFVATQDAELRRNLIQASGVPVIHGLRNALFLEPPSTSDRQYAKTIEEEQLHMTDLELKLLSKDTLVSDTLGSVKKPMFKRKKAKGPNPLSCLKKRNRECLPVSNEEGEAAHSGKRRRKRRNNKT